MLRAKIWKNVYSAVEFLKGTGDDRRPYTGKNMVVIGGGNVAIDYRTARRLVQSM